MTDSPPTIPRYRAAQVVVRQLLTMLGTVVGALFLARWVPALSAAALPGAMAAGVLMALWARAQRVSFGDEALTVRRPWGDRVIPYADITDGEVRWHEAAFTGAPGAAVTLRFVTRGGSAWTVSSDWATLGPAWTRATEPLLARRRAALARGEVLAFADTSRPPWGHGVYTVAVALLFAVAVSAGGRAGMLSFGGMLLFALWGLVYAVRGWRRARDAGGVELAAEGLRALRDHRDDVLGGYREARGAAQGWIPWSDVVAVTRDDAALHIATALPGRVLRITPGAGVAPLHDLLAAQAAAHRTPEVQALRAAWAAAEAAAAEGEPRTGVRLAASAPDAEVVADDNDAHAHDHAPDRAARR